MSDWIPFEYKGQPVRFNTNGWINATDIAKQFGKRPGHWLELPATVEYMEALTRHLNVGESGNLVRTTRGRQGGTWLHPKLAVVFARWLDDDFAVWCGLHIEDVLRGHFGFGNTSRNDATPSGAGECALSRVVGCPRRARLFFARSSGVRLSPRSVLRELALSCAHLAYSEPFHTRGVRHPKAVSPWQYQHGTVATDHGITPTTSTSRLSYPLTVFPLPIRQSTPFGPFISVSAQK